MGFVAHLVWCLLMLATVHLTCGRQFSQNQRNQLKRWMGLFGVRLHRELEITRVGKGQGLGLVAQQRISRGELLFTIPARMAISGLSAERLPLRLRKSLEAAGDCPFDLQVCPNIGVPNDMILRFMYCTQTVDYPPVYLRRDGIVAKVIMLRVPMLPK